MFDYKKMNRIILLVIAAFLVVVGILFCLSKTIGPLPVSILIGIAVMLGGMVPVIRSLANKYSMLTPGALLGGAIIALGIFSIVYRVAIILLALMPFLMIVIGVFSLTEAFMMMFARGERNKVLFVLEIIIGVIMLTLGILMLLIGAMASAAGIIFGIIVLFAGVYMLVMVLVVNADGDNE